VREAVAVAVGTTTRRLAAVVTAGSDVDVEGARAFVADRLPSYMVPEHVVCVAELPLSANGKVDRSAVARLLATGDAEPAEEPLRAGLEAELGTVWSDLLGGPVGGRGQNFFTLGGDSLLATRLLATLREKYGVDLPMRGLLDRPTIADLAVAVSLSQQSGSQRSSQETTYEEGAI
jgi:aryl carrier-like protein